MNSETSRAVKPRSLKAIWIGIDLLYELVDVISWLTVIRIHWWRS